MVMAIYQAAISNKYGRHRMVFGITIYPGERFYEEGIVWLKHRGLLTTDGHPLV